MKILILIRALSAGGAEWQAILLAKGLRETGHAVRRERPDVVYSFLTVANLPSALLSP